MPEYIINKGSQGSERKVNAQEYRHEGEYFVFYDTDLRKVLTIVASGVRHIELAATN